MEEVKNSTLAIMDILVTIKEDLAALREDTQDVKRELATVKEDTQDVKRELATVKEDTQDVKRELVTVKEDTQDVRRELATVKEDTQDVKRELATVKEDTQDVKRELATVKEDTNSTLMDLQVELTGLKEDTQCIKTDVESLRQNTDSTLQDLKMDLVKLNQDTNSTLMNLATLREDTDSTLRDLKMDLKELNHDTNSTLMDLQVELTGLKEDTQCIKSDVESLRQNTNSALQDLKMDLNQDTNSTLMGLATLREDTNSRMQDLQEGLATLRQEGSQERAEVNATVSKIQETVEEDNLIMNSERDASQKHQQFTTEQFSNISEEIQDIQQSFLGLASQCDTSSPVTECNPLVSVQYLPTSCSELPTSSPSGYYWIYNYDVRVYCDFSVTSQQTPALSCEHIATHHPSTPSGYYWVRSSNGSAVNIHCSMTSQQDPTPSCQYIAETHPSTPSGYYWVRSSNGSAVNVYCDMARHCCGSTEGWMRVAYLDMTDTSQQCPEGFRLRSEPKRTCEQIASSCDSILYHSHHIQYSKVCGRVKAYQYGAPVAFVRYHAPVAFLRYYGDYAGQGTTIDSNYVGGMSITHGESPRKHIWTFAAALDERRSNVYACPCTKTDTPYTGRVPPFIGNDYFCDTGSHEYVQSYRFYSENPLWDGEGCGPTSSCCQFNSPPWFCKELPQPTTDDVEVRVCRYDNYRGTPFDLIELYVQ